MRPTWRSNLFVAFASIYLALYYVPSPLRAHVQFVLLSLPLIAAAVLALPWELRGGLKLRERDLGPHELAQGPAPESDSAADSAPPTPLLFL